MSDVILTCRFFGSSREYDYLHSEAVPAGTTVEVRTRHSVAPAEVVRCRPASEHHGRFELKRIEHVMPERKGSNGEESEAF